MGGLLGYSSENSITSLKVPAERERETISVTKKKHPFLINQTNPLMEGERKVVHPTANSLSHD